MKRAETNNVGENKRKDEVKCELKKENLKFLLGGGGGGWHGKSRKSGLFQHAREKRRFMIATLVVRRYFFKKVESEACKKHRRYGRSEKKKNKKKKKKQVVAVVVMGRANREVVIFEMFSVTSSIASLIRPSVGLLACLLANVRFILITRSSVEEKEKRDDFKLAQLRL
ncbi:hypothetical protein M0802_001444 [Mischocyttarus mexicanus]|nr:hypothetical protein M0802_001444 [Mischocyttarus mexicanus]